MGRVAAYTWTLVVLRVPLGVLGARKSDAAIRAATAKTTVVKNPKVFWIRTRDEYMVGKLCAGRVPARRNGMDAYREGDRGFGEFGCMGSSPRDSHVVIQVAVI